MSVDAGAVLCGVGLGLGLWCLAAMLPSLRRPRLADRVAPYLVDVSEEARAHTARRAVDPLPVIGTLAAPALTALKASVGRLLGDGGLAVVRLRQAGSALTLEQFRGRQLLGAVGGAAAGTASIVVVSTIATVPFVAVLMLPVVGAGVGVGICDALLRRRARRRLARLTDELPTVLEFLTLSLSAGESITDAVRRVARTGTGVLAAELSDVVARVATGVPLASALHELAAALRHPSLDRAIGQLTTALERGTPLIEVLRAQAHDARADARNRLIELAGRKEIAMLVPLVFLVLPLTVVIAIFPGLVLLQAGF